VLIIIIYVFLIDFLETPQDTKSARTGSNPDKSKSKVGHALINRL